MGPTTPEPGAPTLLVLGATGSLGSAVCAAASRVLPGARLLRASRRPPAGAGWVRVEIRDEASLRAAIAGAAVAIDAIGPYDYDPAPLLRACGEAGCHLVDVADRGAFLSATEAAAEGAAIAVVGGCAAVPSLAEALAAPFAGDPATRSLRVGWSVGSRKRVSGALLYALLRPLGREGPGAVTLRSVQGVPFWFGRRPWPRCGGARVGGRRLPVEASVGMDRKSQALALRALAPLLGRMPDAALLVACRALRPTTRWITRFGDERGCLFVEALDATGRVRGSLEVLAPRGFDLVTLPALWAARALLARRPRLRGLVALADLAGRAELAGWMREEGWIVTGP